MSAKLELLAILTDIQANGPPDRESGICYQIGLKTPSFEVASLVTVYAMRWPEFSGNSLYPVPSPDDRKPWVAYNHASEYEMWSRDSAYGASRWRLVDFIVSELSKNSEEVANAN